MQRKAKYSSGGGWLLITVAICACVLHSARGQEEAFKVGFLLRGSELGEVRATMEELRVSLLSNEKVGDALEAGGYGDIWLRPSDEPFDMIQRLRAGEFELAFATSVIYARQFESSGVAPSLSRRNTYEPIAQFYRPGSDILDPRGNGVWRKGVIFAGPGSSLWKFENPTTDQISQALIEEQLAVSDSYSAAGYIFSRLKLHREFPELDFRGTMFCGSDEEAIKHVVSGLVGLGSCESGSLAAVEGSNSLVKEIYQTDRIPTDPILIRGEFAPGGSKSGLGAEIKLALQAFFNSGPTAITGLRVERAVRRSYEDMARALTEFDALDAESPTDREPNRP